MIGDIAIKVSEKAKEIAAQEVTKFVMDNPAIDVSNEIREKVAERAISQLTFHLSSLKLRPGEDENDQFNDWFSTTQEESLRKACRMCVKEELEKNKLFEEDDPNMSFLDRYLKEHKRKRHLGQQ